MMTTTASVETLAQPPQPAVLMRLAQTSFRGSTTNALHLSNVSLAIRAGQLIYVQIDRARQSREVASLFQGIELPDQGHVLFQERIVDPDDYESLFAMRAKIGRVFDDSAWVQNLNVYDNLTQARLHHGEDPASIRDRFEGWLRRLSINDVSRQRPAFVEPDVLQAMQWVRALLGKPDVLIMERPMRLLAPERVTTLVEALSEHHDRGGATIWFSSNPPETDLPGAEALVSRRIEIVGGIWTAEETQ